MNREISVKNVEEFEDLVSNESIFISEILVETILKNLSSKKKFIYALSVFCEDDDSIYDITVERKYFSEILEENRIIQEKNGYYEKCAEIRDAIIFLRK